MNPLQEREVAVLRAFVEELAEGVTLAHAELEAKLDTLVQVREDAQAALERCYVASEQYERFARFAARAADGNVAAIDLLRAVEAIETMVGGRFMLAKEAA